VLSEPSKGDADFLRDHHRISLKNKLDGGHRMKRVFFCFIILIMHSICYGGDPDSGYGTLIAVEIRVNNEFTGIVGKLEYTGRTVDMVTFGPGVAGIGIIALPEVCNVIEKTINSKGVHHIKCENQYGTVASGTIDFHDSLKPKVTLVRESGHVITNISNEGKGWQKRNIPNILLGQ